MDRLPKQNAIKLSRAKRKVVRAGRRGAKTVTVSQIAIERFLNGRRQLYAVPTQEQVDAFWFEVKRALAEPINAGIFVKNETLHTIELPGTKQRIRAKTAWNADTLRGDYADDLYLDEYQLMNEEAWEVVGAPMLLDNNGDVIFIYTPPSLHSKSVTKASDPCHAAKLYKKAEAAMKAAFATGTEPRWEVFHFTSLDNPYLSTEALGEIAQDMTNLAYRQEILAEDLEEAPGALWTRELLNKTRVIKPPSFVRVVIGVDPPGGATECGIVVAGLGADKQGYIISDRTLKASPDIWAGEVISAAGRYIADMVVGEANYGGDMVDNTIKQAAISRNVIVRYKHVQATRGKAVRAEPIVALFEQGRAHLIGQFPELEDELTMWIPGETKNSPNRLDAMVWAMTELFPAIPEPQEEKIIFDSMKLVGDIDL